MRYAARVADQEIEHEGRDLIRARVAVWRAQAWTAWLPSMVVLPGAIILTPMVVEVLRSEIWPSRRGHVGMRVGELAEYAVPVLIMYGALAFLASSRVQRARFVPRVNRRMIVLMRGVRVGIVIACGASIVWCLGLVAVRQRSDGGAEAHVPLLLSILGGLVLTGWVGIRRRVALQCGRCGYAIGSVWRAGEVCPECGNAWKGVGGLRRCRRISGWWLIAGVGLIVLGGVLGFLGWN